MLRSAPTSSYAGRQETSEPASSSRHGDHTSSSSYFYASNVCMLFSLFSLYCILSCVVMLLHCRLLLVPSSLKAAARRAPPLCDRSSRPLGRPVVRTHPLPGRRVWGT